MSDEEYRYDREPDPEVIADLQLRASSQYDRSRVGLLPRSPQFVADWKCRHPRCSTMVPVTQAAVDHLEMFNDAAWTSRRGEKPIPTDAIVVCDEHRLEVVAYRSAKLRERTDKLAQVIRDVKASKNPRRETALIKQLQDFHHPDIEGLLQAIETRLSGKATKQRGDKL